MRNDPRSADASESAPLGADVRNQRRQRAAKWLVAAALIAGAAGLLAYKETRTAERDWHAVRAQIAEIERAVRRHDAYAYARDGRLIALQLSEAAAARLVADLERLSHLEGFALRDVQVRIDAQMAYVTYRVEGTPTIRSERAPKGGEWVFRRQPDGWRLVDGRLIAHGQQ